MYNFISFLRITNYCNISSRISLELDEVAELTLLLCGLSIIIAWKLVSSVNTGDSNL